MGTLFPNNRSFNKLQASDCSAYLRYLLLRFAVLGIQCFVIPLLSRHTLGIFHFSFVLLCFFSFVLLCFFSFVLLTFFGFVLLCFFSFVVLLTFFSFVLLLTFFAFILFIPISCIFCVFFSSLFSLARTKVMMVKAMVRDKQAYWMSFSVSCSFSGSLNKNCSPIQKDRTPAKAWPILFQTTLTYLLMRAFSIYPSF